jgi:CPA2 family monovalent cation:H+ antiporter-2
VNFLASENFLEDMALVMCLAALAAVVCQLLRQLLIVGYLCAGIIAGPYTPGIVANTERVQLVSDLAVTILVFSIGLEFKFRKLLRLVPTGGLVAVIQAGAMICLGYLTGRMLGWTQWDSLVTGAMLSISGAVIMARALEEVRVDPRVRELVFGVVLCEDVVAILLMAVMITLVNGGEFSLQAVSINAGLVGSFIVALVMIGLMTVPFMVRGVERFDRREILLITSLGLCFAFAMLAERLHYSLVLGSFLAGSLVAESGQGEKIDELIEPVRHLFGAIFFVSVGMIIDPQLLATHWVALVVLSAMVLGGKIISVSLGSVLVGECPDTAIKAGFTMAQIGIFSILIAGVGTGGAAAHSSIYALAVGVTAVTAFLCPLLIRASNPVADWIDGRLPAPVQAAFSRYAGWLHRIHTFTEAATTERGEASERQSTVNK